MANFSLRECLIKDRAAGTYHDAAKIPAKTMANLEETQRRVNKFVERYPKPLICNCLWRDPSGVQPAGGATNSPHHFALGMDIQDTDGAFARWVMNNLAWLAECDLYMECPLYTHTCAPNKKPTSGWVHLDRGGWSETGDPKSRTTRIFQPF